MEEENNKKEILDALEKAGSFNGFPGFLSQQAAARMEKSSKSKEIGDYVCLDIFTFEEPSPVQLFWRRLFAPLRLLFRYLDL